MAPRTAGAELHKTISNKLRDVKPDESTYDFGHLERSVEDDRLTRALGARLDRAFKRADISSARGRVGWRE